MEALCPTDTISVRLKPQAGPRWGRHPDSLGRYRVLGELARGGMSVVLRAYDDRRDCEVAVKIANQPGSSEEARLVSRLRHPGIVKIHDTGRLPDGRAYLVMPLVTGETMAARIARGIGCRRAFVAVCQAVGHAHRRGVVHRDLKPANVMIDPAGTVTVLDWGVACAVGEGEEGPVVSGTPAYMAPEQARGQRSDLPSSDLFGLGGLLCEMLTGAPPRIGVGEADLARIAAGDQEGWTRRLDDCDADEPLKELALRCLSVDPACRPATAEAVAQAFCRSMQAVPAQ